MPIAGNSIDNNALASLTRRAGTAVTSAIQQASAKTGVDFAYLMEKAAAESSFKTDAKAKTSSASGLYQFIESTWLQMVNRYGDKYGLGEYADHINDKGKVDDPALRGEILSLRNDPKVAALMAGEFAAENRRTLINAGIDSKDIGSTELYLAHFLGAGAASEFIKGMQENPLTPAANIFPRAAAANKNVFYDTNTQKEKSLGEIYAFFDKKFGSSKNPSIKSQSAITSVASATKEHTNNTTAARILPHNIGAVPYAQNTTLATQASLIDFNIDTNGILALMGARDQQSWQGANINTLLPLSRTLVHDPVALMLMAQTDLMKPNDKENKSSRNN